MRRRRPPHPKQGKTGDHQYLRVNLLPQRKTAVASPKAREREVTRKSGPEHAEVPSGQRRTATASMTASYHEKRREGSRDHYRSQRPPGEQAKVAAVNDSGNSRDRSRQCDFGGAASSQKTATGHTETTRANAMKREQSVDRQRSHSDRTRQTSKRGDPPTQRLDR